MTLVFERINDNAELVRLSQGKGYECLIYKITYNPFELIIRYEVAYGMNARSVFRRILYNKNGITKHYFNDILLAHSVACDLVEKQCTAEEAHRILREATDGNRN